MAMGDLNAGEFGQAGHLLVALRDPAIAVSELIYIKSRPPPPRSNFAGGVIQDDFASLRYFGAIVFGLGTWQNGRLMPTTFPHRQSSALLG